MASHKVESNQSTAATSTSGKFSDHGSSLDDYVVDYPPKPDIGSRRTHKIWCGGCKCNLGAPFGITYIFVQGKESACLITRTRDQSVTSIPAKNFFHNLKNIKRSLADPRFDDFEKSLLGLRTSKKFGDLDQFAVVSVLLSPDEVKKEIGFESDKASTGSFNDQAAINVVKERVSSASFNEQAAINFLKEKLENNSPFTFVETIQTAISALEYLYQVNLEASEIEVYAVGDMGLIKKYLPIEEIEWHLTQIHSSY